MLGRAADAALPSCSFVCRVLLSAALFCSTPSLYRIRRYCACASHDVHARRHVYALLGLLAPRIGARWTDQTLNSLEFMRTCATRVYTYSNAPDSHHVSAGRTQGSRIEEGRSSDCCPAFWQLHQETITSSNIVRKATPTAARRQHGDLIAGSVQHRYSSVTCDLILVSNSTTFTSAICILTGARMAEAFRTSLIIESARCKRGICKN